MVELRGPAEISSLIPASPLYDKSGPCGWLEHCLSRFLDEPLDELAAGIHASTASRLFAALMVGPLALAFLPWPVCLAWTTVVFALEAVSWVSTRSAYQGRAVTRADRIGHWATMGGGAVNWCLIGIMFWRHGTAAAAVSAHPTPPVRRRAARARLALQVVKHNPFGKILVSFSYQAPPVICAMPLT